MRNLELDRCDFDRLHDRIHDVFDIHCTDEQILKLLTLCPNWDGIVDTLGESEVMDKICKHFIGMSVPMYGSSQDYKDKFRKEAESKKMDVIFFIKKQND